MFAALIFIFFRSILLRAARFLRWQLKVGNENFETVLHKQRLLPLSLSYLLLLTFSLSVCLQRQLQEERKGIPGRPLRGAEVPARGGDRPVHSR